MHELGYNTNEYELEDAFKSLDSNNNGRIDYNEFRRWFLNGQKSFIRQPVRSLSVGNETQVIEMTNSKVEDFKKELRSSGNVDSQKYIKFLEEMSKSVFTA